MTSKFIRYYDDTPIWIPVGTNKDDLEWPWKGLNARFNFLADSVDTSLASLLYSSKRDAVLSEVHDQWVSRERRVKLTRCLSAVAELLVVNLKYTFKLRDMENQLMHYSWP